MLPPEVSLLHEGLGLLQNSYLDLEGKTDEITERAAAFTERNNIHGLIVTGGFVTLFNPGLECRIAEAVHVPVTSAVAAVAAALQALAAGKLLLVTPFTADMNRVIAQHLTALGFTVFLGPAFDENRKPGAGVDIRAEELFDRVEESYRQNPAAEAIYFQGATLDPLAILQPLEDKLGVPAVASNPAMLWSILSKLGRRFSIEGYGTLLRSWPGLQVGG